MSKFPAQKGPVSLMKIIDLLKQGNITLSCEISPPKANVSLDHVHSVIAGVAATCPDFISVTYGAGGSTSKRTLEISQEIQQKHNIPAVAHLTCMTSSRAEIDDTLQALKQHGIQNILALRGDIPENFDANAPRDFQYAYQLIEEIKTQGDFCIGGACYPEGHVECDSKERDIDYLKQKVESGCDFLTSQMFFDNTVFYQFLYRTLAKGIRVPILPGIMPVTNSRQIKRICALSGTVLPARFKAIVERFADHPEAMKQAGIAYATEQIIDLIANGVNNIHLYTMNKPEIAQEIVGNLSDILVVGNPERGRA